MKATRRRDTYDRGAVGSRLKLRREGLGWTRKYVAMKAGLVEKYYADIERGSCGMSIETLISLTDLYGFGLDELLFDGIRDRDAIRRMMLSAEYGEEPS